MDDRFTAASLRAALGGRPFRFYQSAGSTQDLARDWALSNPELPDGAVVIAEYQAAGRGRQGRRWIAAPGSSIMCSVILRPHIVLERLPRLTMAGGIAVAETLSALLDDGIALKWPNDVLVRGRKISGILSEAAWMGDRLEAVIMGIGLNVRMDFAGTDLAERATTLEAELGHPIDRHVVLANLLAHVLLWTERIQEPVLFETWRRWLGTLGKHVTVYPKIEGGEEWDGIAEGVDTDGALLVRTPQGVLRRVLAADVGLWENE